MKVHKVFSLSLYRTFLNPKLVNVEDTLRQELLTLFEEIREGKGYHKSQVPQPSKVKLSTLTLKDNSEQKKDYTRYSDTTGCLVTNTAGNSYDLTIYNPNGSVESGLMPNNRLKYNPTQDMYTTGTDLTCESVTLRLSEGDLFLWDSSVEYSITPRDDTSHVEMTMIRFYTDTYGM